MEDQSPVTESLKLGRYLVKHPDDNRDGLTLDEALFVEQSAASAFINEVIAMEPFQRRAQAKFVSWGLKFIRKSCTPINLTELTEAPEAFKRRFIGLLKLSWSLQDLLTAEAESIYVTRDELLAYKRVVEKALNGREPYPVTIVTTPPTTSEPRGQEAA